MLMYDRPITAEQIELQSSNLVGKNKLTPGMTSQANGDQIHNYPNKIGFKVQIW